MNGHAWSERATEILHRMCPGGEAWYPDDQIAAWIEAQTGKRPAIVTIRKRRSDLGIKGYNWRRRRYAWEAR